MKNLKDGKTYVIDLDENIIREVLGKDKKLHEPVTEINLRQVVDVTRYQNGKIGVAFSDGTVIPFEASGKEIALLESTAEENRRKGIFPSNPIRTRPLTEEEKRRILTERIREVRKEVPLFFAFGSFLLYLLGIGIYIETGFDDKLLNFIFLSLVFLYVVTCIVVWRCPFLFMKAEEKEVQALKALKNRDICRLSSFWFNSFCR